MRIIILNVILMSLFFLDISRVNINFPLYYLNFEPKIKFNESKDNTLIKLENNLLLIKGNFGEIDYNKNIHKFNEIYLLSPSLHSIGNKLYDLEILIVSENQIGNKIILCYLFNKSNSKNFLFKNFGFAQDLIKSIPIFSKRNKFTYKLNNDINLKTYLKKDYFLIYQDKSFISDENVTYLINYRNYNISKFNLLQLNNGNKKNYETKNLNKNTKVFFNFELNKYNKNYFIND